VNVLFVADIMDAPRSVKEMINDELEESNLAYCNDLADRINLLGVAIIAIKEKLDELENGICLAIEFMGKK
jgi:hypothetical protein